MYIYTRLPCVRDQAQQLFGSPYPLSTPLSPHHSLPDREPTYPLLLPHAQHCYSTMNPSTFTPPTYHSSGWDLPEEILHECVSSIELKTEEEFHERRHVAQRAKHALVAPSLVNRHWSTMLRPLLFRSLALRSRADALFLQDLVRSPAFATSVATAITAIHVWYTTPLTEPWVCHVQWLMHRLPRAELVWYPHHACVPDGRTRTVSALLSPYASMPSVPPSFLRLTSLHLDGAHFASCTKLVSLVDSFPTLTHCYCADLRFSALPPYVLPRWRSRQLAARRPLRYCRIAAAKDMTLAGQTALASDILWAPVPLRLDDGAWRAVLEAMVSLVPDTWEQATLELCSQDDSRFGQAVIGFSDTFKPAPNVVEAHIYVRQPENDSSPHEGPLPRYIWSIDPTGSFPGLHTAGTTSLDELANNAAVSRLEEVEIWARQNNKTDSEGMKAVLCAVLHRTQLTWALDSHRLKFEQRLDNDERHVLSSEQILSMAVEHTIDDHHLVLTVPEQVEWLLHPTTAAKDAYLRQLPAQRASAITSVGADTGGAGPSADHGTNNVQAAAPSILPRA